ncbi:PREDICTED: probable leucine-rich repeat receptor-like protein kinase At5g49770 isoform X2 [Nelumbo nucifera]|uniref:non-specific serine/threonine protein kinase n=1 Tax=Nelumbo nucifera TaxID=4432 RepID=A0A1U7ZTJ3_NELNU|nr:PREDICTED: probable leucine-rich repeat receptor-like protein kinase At5g49770 isoform X2 [Nelumbo nucifera]
MDEIRIKFKACLLLVVLIQISSAAAQQAPTDPNDAAALNSFKLMWKNRPPNWENSDPCVGGWVGVTCNNSQVISIKLSSMGLEGQLSGDIGALTELQTLDLSYNRGLNGPLPAEAIGSLKKLSNLILVGCSFSGRIPSTIGDLEELVFLSLNSNSFTGEIPPSIGKLSKLYWLDIADNKLSGTIPVSSSSTPGLDMLLHAKHFHFGKNQLSGTIPPQLFSSNMSLIHLLFDNNRLSGSIPSTLGLLEKLEVLRLDRNLLSGSVPSDLNNLKNIGDLHLSNNLLKGPMPNLTGVDSITYLDLSNNSFTTSDIPQWILTLQSLTTLVMENTQLEGPLPQALFGIPQLQTLLKDNPICHESVYDQPPAPYCTPQRYTSSYSTKAENCTAVSCLSDQKLSPTCKCSYPYKGILYFRSPSFSDLFNTSYYGSLENKLKETFQNCALPVDSVSLSSPRKDSDNYLDLDLEVFPYGAERFNQSGVLNIGFVLSNQTFKPPQIFGPFFFMGSPYEFFLESSSSSKNSVSLGVVIGAAVGGLVLLLALLFAGYLAFYQKKRADRVIEQNNKSFSSWDHNSSGNIPQLKGARWFSFEELNKCTNNFSEANAIGSGGYGKVYRGILSSGQLVAIKRAQQGSMQGGVEFKTEIELLSRVHHRNLVGLVGFCFQQREQMLVYEYIPNGTLKESLSGKSGVRLDWARRLRVALGSARGLAYLHEHANPSIIHRDIKSTNILLDDRLNAKVADFGLSKLMGDTEKDHITTQVKGTMGYLDPEYYMSQMLTEKSDVYSFGVLLLELITAKKPLERGKHIVREVRISIDKTKDLYGLHQLLDPAIGLGTSLKGFEKYVDLAMSCTEETGADRPIMSEVVKEIENIMQFAGLNPNADSASTSGSHSGGHSKHPYNNESFDFSGTCPPHKVEPQ